MFLEKLSNQIKKCNSIKKIKIKLGGFRKIVKKEFKNIFLEPSDELLNRVWSVSWYCINSVYV